MEQSIKYEVEIMLKIADMSMYYGLDNYLKTIITREDELERRYNRDYLDYIALTLLYHQIIEKFLESIVMINNFNIALNMFPQKIEMKMKKKNSFYDLIESVKNSFEFSVNVNIKMYKRECGHKLGLYRYSKFPPVF